MDDGVSHGFLLARKTTNVGEEWEVPVEGPSHNRPREQTTKHTEVGVRNACWAVLARTGLANSEVRARDTLRREIVMVAGR